MPRNKKLALKLGIQTYQILTNDDEVCIPSLSSILLAVKCQLDSDSDGFQRISIDILTNFDNFQRIILYYIHVSYQDKMKVIHGTVQLCCISRRRHVFIIHHLLSELSLEFLLVL